MPKSQRTRESKLSKTASERLRLRKLAFTLGKNILALTGGYELEDVRNFSTKAARRVVQERRQILNGLMEERGFVGGAVIVPGCGEYPDVPHKIVSGQIEGGGKIKLLMPAGGVQLVKAVDLAKKAEIMWIDAGDK